MSTEMIEVKEYSGDWPRRWSAAWCSLQAGFLPLYGPSRPVLMTVRAKPAWFPDWLWDKLIDWIRDPNTSPVLINGLPRDED